MILRNYPTHCALHNLEDAVRIEPTCACNQCFSNMHYTTINKVIGRLFDSLSSIGAAADFKLYSDTP
jgi:hypothetical protein